MANIKFSDFNAQTNLDNFDGLVGFESTDAPFGSPSNANYYITLPNFYDTLEANLNLTDFTTGVLPVAQGGSGQATFAKGFLKADAAAPFTTTSTISLNGGVGGDISGILPIEYGGTGIGPVSTDPDGVLGVAFVGALIDEASQVAGDTLAFDIDPTDPTKSILVTQNPSKGVPFSFMVVVNRAVGPAGYYTMSWNALGVGWQYADNQPLAKYTQTAANPLIRRNLFNEEQATDLEITWGMSGVAGLNYEWELRLEDPAGIVPDLVLTDSAQAGFLNTIVSFNPPSTWGVGWMQARVTNVSLAAFFGPGLATEGELSLYVAGPVGGTFANVGCEVRFFSIQ